MLHLQISDARKLIIATGLALAERKLILGSWGNISMKIEKDCFAITPSGRSYDQLKPDDSLCKTERSHQYNRFVRQDIARICLVQKNWSKV